MLIAYIGLELIFPITLYPMNVPHQRDRLTLWPLGLLRLCPDVLDTLHHPLKLGVVGVCSLLVAQDLVIVAPPGAWGLDGHRESVFIVTDLDFTKLIHNKVR